MTEDQVDEVRAAAAVEEIIGEFVPLRRSGRSYQGKCPFHEDSSPSFSVVPGQGYRCFGCGETGDVFTFVMKKLGLDFPEAVRWVAARAGVPLPERRAREGEEDPLRPFFEANAFAAHFYQERLLDPEAGAAARGYLERRGITPAIIERFRIGYAPDDWRELRDAAVRHGMDDALLLDAGLTTSNEKRSEPWDRFRNRIIFPIEGSGGRILAFGGRLLPPPPGHTAAGSEAPKYLNSPETPVYHKGEVLYGLPRARQPIRQAGVALLVEGYLDLVSLHAAGVENAVATLGTATTPEQARLLARLARRAILLFDSDPAGMKAAFRASDTLLAEGVHPTIATLPPGEDPDTLVRRDGADALRTFLDGAVDVIERKLQMLDERGFLGTIEGTRSALDRLLPTVRACKDPAIRDLYITRIASRTGIRPETIEGELAGKGGAAPPSGGSIRGAASEERAPRLRRPVPLPLPRLGAERELLRLLVRDRDWIERAMERIGADDFTDPAFRTIFRALADDPELRHPPAGMDPGAARRLEDLLADTSGLAHPTEVFESAIWRMLEAGTSARLEELDRRMRDATSFEEQRALMEERMRLSREGRAGRVDWLSAARRSARPKEEGRGGVGPRSAPRGGPPGDDIQSE